LTADDDDATTTTTMIMTTLQFKFVSQTDRVLSDVSWSCSYWHVQTGSGGGIKKLIVQEYGLLNVGSAKCYVVIRDIINT